MGLGIPHPHQTACEIPPAACRRSHHSTSMADTSCSSSDLSEGVSLTSGLSGVSVAGSSVLGSSVATAGFGSCSGSCSDSRASPSTAATGSPSSETQIPAARHSTKTPQMTSRRTDYRFISSRDVMSVIEDSPLVQSCMVSVGSFFFPLPRTRKSRLQEAKALYAGRARQR